MSDVSVIIIGFLGRVLIALQHEEAIFSPGTTQQLALARRHVFLCI